MEWPSEAVNDLPQPLSKVAPDANIYFSVEPVQANPPLGVLIATVISEWARTEVELGSSLAELLGTSSHVGMAMYSALRSTTAQQAAMEAAANAVLKGDDLDLYMAILLLANAAHTERSTIAHGIWGASAELPDALLLRKQTEMLTVFSHSASVRANWPNPATTPPPKNDRSLIMVYKAKDFESLIKRIIRIQSHLLDFTFYPGIGPITPEGGQLRQTLYNKPDIQEALNRIRARRQRTASTPSQSPPTAPAST